MSNQIRLESVIPLPLPNNELQEIIEKAKDWAVMHGIGMRSKQHFSKDSLLFAPFSLLPSVYPRKEFQKGVDIQPILNEMMHRVAHNPDFLRSCLKDIIQVDEFTGNLFKIYETVLDEGMAQPISLGLLRSDVMLESACVASATSSHDLLPNLCVKQVEMNTIAAGFGWLGPASAHIQRFVLQQLGHLEKLVNLPENNALRGLCEGMLEAWKIYGKEKAVILFVIEDVSYNICDQRFHEFELAQLQPIIKVIRRTLTQIFDEAHLSATNELIIDGHTVAVIYFRAGYEPGHYPSQKEWDARLLMERSQAIKCPSIQYHLAGTKKVQQCLARYGAVEMFLSDAHQIEAVKDVFTGLYSLDFDEFGDQAVQMALDNPERFVLKPQREGGGNNVYGTDIKDMVLTMKDSKERTAWILMERIVPPLISGYIIRPGETAQVPEPTDLVSELGIFGVIIGDSEKIISNRHVGHMLRSKLATANETGVVAGSGALDSPYLVG